MSLKIDRGLFKYDFIDYHAVLCVPVDAEIKDIRKRYLQIARRLHPDSCVAATESEKQLANELLSKLVNPAYEKLSVERTRVEYLLVLSQIGKRLVQEQSAVDLTSSLAKQLATAPNIDQVYRSAIAKIAQTQFDALQQVPQVVAQISELNLVYLMRSASQSFGAPSSIQAKINSSSPQPIANGTTTNTQAPTPPKEDSAVEQYIRRAETLMAKNQFAQAKVELQDALKLEPKNSRCHSLIGEVYLRQNQLKMAKVHFENALKLDPNDSKALEWKPKIDKVLAKQSGASQVNSSPSHGGKQPDSSGGGGLFGGLFGGKKK
jgi:curved DNA-binding protein CbpA